MEYRVAIDTEIRDIDADRHQVLVEFPHERLDSFNTTFSRDCFAESFADEAPVMCWMHQRAEPIGRALSAQVLPTKNELVGQFDDFDAVPLARRAFTQIASGTITDFSFGFERRADEAHPKHRGGRRITKARMYEFSPVVGGSIPGARAVALRSELDETEGLVPTDVATIRQLCADKVISRTEARAMLEVATAGLILAEERKSTDMVECPTCGGSGQLHSDRTDGKWVDCPDCQGQGEVTKAKAKEIADRPGPEARAAPGYAPGATHTEDSASLAQAIDAALDSACDYLAGVDVSALPPDAAQAIALVQAAGVAADELLDCMGVPDADEAGREAEGETRAEGDRIDMGAPWHFDASKYSLDQLARAALIKVGDGSTKDDYKLPIRTPDGTLVRSAIHAAAAVLGGARGGVDAPADAKAAAAKTILGYYHRMGEKAPPGVAKLAGADTSDTDDDDDARWEARRTSAEAVFASRLGAT